jgi:hypothetical protein
VIADDVLFAAVEDDGRAVFAGRDGSVTYFDLARGARIASWRVDAEPTAVALDTVGPIVGDVTGRLHRFRGARDAAVFVAHAGAVRALRVEADGRLWSLGEDGARRAWRLDGATRWPGGALTNLRVCPDSRDVVAVTPWPPPESVFADPAACPTSQR